MRWKFSIATKSTGERLILHRHIIWAKEMFIGHFAAHAVRYNSCIIVQTSSDSQIFGALQLDMKKEKFKSFFLLGTQKRATHTRAGNSGGFGEIKIVDNPQFPEHEFFRADRTFPARIRHGNVRSPDDAGADARSFSIRFADNDSESPMDIIMNTGEANIFWNIPSLEEFEAVNKGASAEGFVFKNPY
jgi:arachidonate 5-lipoxygenase